MLTQTVPHHCVWKIEKSFRVAQPFRLLLRWAEAMRCSMLAQGTCDEMISLPMSFVENVYSLHCPATVRVAQKVEQVQHTLVATAGSLNTDRLPAARDVYRII